MWAFTSSCEQQHLGSSESGSNRMGWGGAGMRERKMSDICHWMPHVANARGGAKAGGTAGFLSSVPGARRSAKAVENGLGGGVVSGEGDRWRGRIRLGPSSLSSPKQAPPHVPTKWYPS